MRPLTRSPLTALVVVFVVVFCVRAHVHPPHRRIANSGVIGFCWAGYVTPMVYGFADRTVPGLSVLNVLQKTCISIGVLGTVRGASWRGAV